MLKGEVDKISAFFPFKKSFEKSSDDRFTISWSKVNMKSNFQVTQGPFALAKPTKQGG